MPKNAAETRFFFDGERMFMDINLGKIKFFNKEGSEEIYTANKIELHTPAEHYITLSKQTPRASLEMHIIHKLETTDLVQATNLKMEVKQAIVAIQFIVGDIEEGDKMLNAFGFNSKNK